jgi:hypothetical protein
MKHEIIKLDNYLLVVDESEIKIGDWYYLPRTNEGYKCQEDPTELEMEKRFGVRKIIAHLPLNGSLILEGMDLLPPLEEEDSIGWPLIHYINEKHNQDRVMGFCDGYNKAKEKYKYTEEDMRKAWNAAYIDAMSIDEETYKPLFFEDFIQSLSQPKMPIGFECETSPMNIDEIREQGKGFLNANTNKIKTTTTPEGHTQWVGTYIYE